MFSCTAIADIILWQVNGSPVDRTIRNKGFNDTEATVTLNETQSLRKATLKVLGSADSNGTRITCIILSPTNIVGDMSGPALLLVQGDELLLHTILVVMSILLQVYWVQSITSL